MNLVQETRLEMFWMMLLARRPDERAWVLHRQRLHLLLILRTPRVD